MNEEPLLTYEVTSTPTTIHASPDSGEDVFLSLAIKVSNKTTPHQAINCRSIRFDFPKGSGAKNLFADDDEIAPMSSSPQWTLSAHGSGFTATPKSAPASIGTAPIYFHFDNIKVNKQPGIAEFTIVEETEPARTATKIISIAKFPADQNTLLTYDIDPKSVETSPATGDRSLANLTVSVSNSGGVAVGCRSISFMFPVGTNAKDLVFDVRSIATIVASGWSIASTDGGFVATPVTTATGSVGGQGLAFQFKDLPINTEVGTSHIAITEVTTADLNHTGSVSKPVSKTLRALEIKTFTADPKNTKEGLFTTLSWEGTIDAEYSIEYTGLDGIPVTIRNPKGEPNQPLPSKGSYKFEPLQVANNAVTDIVFTLKASRSGESIPKEVTVTVSPAKPQIKSFNGKISYTSGAPVLVLSWETEEASNCRINDDVVPPSATARKIPLKESEDLTESYTLTASNNTGSVKSALKVIFSPQLIKSVQAPGAANISVFPDGTQIFLGVNRDKRSVWGNSHVALVDSRSLSITPSYVVGGGTDKVGAVAKGPDYFYMIQVASYGEGPDLGTYLKVFWSDARNSQLPDRAFGLAVAPKGDRIYVIGAGRKLWVFAQKSMGLVQTVDLKKDGRSAAVSTDGTCLYLACGNESQLRVDGTILMLNAGTLATSNEVSVYSTGKLGTRFGLRILIGPAKTILVSTGDDAIPILFLTDPRLLRAGETPKSLADAPANWVQGLIDFDISPDYQYLYTISDDGTLGMYSTLIVTSKESLDLQISSDGAYVTVTFVADQGKYLVTVGYNQSPYGLGRHDVTVQGTQQTVSVRDRIPRLMIQESAEVTVTGFPSGPIKKTFKF